MAILTKEQALQRLKDRIGDDVSDEALAIIEDFNDTFDDYETRSKGDGENWKSKYEDLDATWRKKYKDRFFTSPEEVKEEQEENVKDDGKTKSFDELFEKKEG